MNHDRPTDAEVLKHFKNAKEIHCLNLNIPIDVSYVKKFSYKPDINSYVAIGGKVTFWVDGKYAKITKKKVCDKDCIDCKNCSSKKNSKK